MRTKLIPDSAFRMGDKIEWDFIPLYDFVVSSRKPSLTGYRGCVNRIWRSGIVHQGEKLHQWRDRPALKSSNFL
jgi:hypothetical protein